MRQVVDLPWSKPPLTGNDGGHARYRPVAKHLREAMTAVQAAGLSPVSGPGMRVTLHLLVATWHRRDSDNLYTTFKVCQDALVRSGVIPDDSFVQVRSATCEIHPPTGEPARMWLEIESPDD